MKETRLPAHNWRGNVDCAESCPSPECEAIDAGTYMCVNRDAAGVCSQELPQSLQQICTPCFFRYFFLTFSSCTPFFIANASPSGFVPQVRTKEPFPLVIVRIFLATKLLLRDINLDPFLQFNKLLHHVLSRSVSSLWCPFVWWLD